ncbi:hypothetical protein M432DRAFT_611147 [Thermoascus aurantiacus ATCC 26904]
MSFSMSFFRCQLFPLLLISPSCSCLVFPFFFKIPPKAKRNASSAIQIRQQTHATMQFDVIRVESISVLFCLPCVVLCLCV